MTQQEEIINTIKVLRKEVEVLTTRLKPHATGYLHTTIDTVNDRIDELMQEALYRQNELTGTLRGINGNLDADVYDGYKDHTEAIEQARLRKIQDSAAGRKPDDYEHTKEYQDTERNKSKPDIQNMSSDGPSNRSMKTMKQIQGQAVQTTSEQMQEELEPLPINIFK